MNAASPISTPEFSAVPESTQSSVTSSPHPPVTPPSLATSTKKSGREGKEERRNPDVYEGPFLRWTKRYEAVINGFSAIVMAVFSVILTIYTVRLWKSGEKHSERELRAYVWVSVADIRFIGTERQMLATFKICNDGQTPAHNVTVSAQFGTGPIVVNKEDLPPAPYVLGPHGGFILHRELAPFIWTKEEFNDFVRGGGVFVHGEILYTDAFGRDRFTRFSFLHWTTFSEPGPDEVFVFEHADGDMAS